MCAFILLMSFIFNMEQVLLLFINHYYKSHYFPIYNRIYISIIGLNEIDFLQYNLVSTFQCKIIFYTIYILHPLLVHFRQKVHFISVFSALNSIFGLRVSFNLCVKILFCCQNGFVISVRTRKKPVCLDYI